jgi:FAD/FMN-containing dehydrogenase
MKSFNPPIRTLMGVRNIVISEAVAEFGLYYAPDPSSQIACTIGGNVAENSGGVHCLKYGLTVHNVEAIKMLEFTNRKNKNATPELKKLTAPLIAFFHALEHDLSNCS